LRERGRERKKRGEGRIRKKGGGKSGERGRRK